jgi:hypothetical protein
MSDVPVRFLVAVIGKKGTLGTVMNEPNKAK